LQLELVRQKIPNSRQGKASQGLTDIGHPSIDWVALAKGMGVHQAVRAHTAAELATALDEALDNAGPNLIECLL